MTELDLLICGSLWQRTAHPEAGWELVCSLRSADTSASALAQEFLIDAGLRSMNLLQGAVASGAIRGREAAECMCALLLRPDPNEEETGLDQLQSDYEL